MLFGCGGQRPEIKNDLVTLIGRLPTIQTPVTFDSDKPVSVLVKIDQDIIDSLQNKIPGYGILGKLFETDAFTAIVGIVPNDTGSPQILIFDKTGKQIDSYFAYRTAGGDMGLNSKNVVTINPNREILFIDSTWTMKINNEGTDVIKGTDSLAVAVEKYKISDTGMVEKMR